MVFSITIGISAEKKTFIEDEMKGVMSNESWVMGHECGGEKGEEGLLNKGTANLDGCDARVLNKYKIKNSLNVFGAAPVYQK